MSVDRHKREFAFGALLVAALGLSGCSSSIIDLPGTGQTSNAASAKEPDPYLPVHDIPPDRDEAVIPPAERVKIQAELIKARDRQASEAATQASATQSAAAK